MGLLGSLLSFIPVVGPAVGAAADALTPVVGGLINRNNQSKSILGATNQVSVAADKNANDLIAEGERGSSDILHEGERTALDVEGASQAAQQGVAAGKNESLARLDDAGNFLNPYISAGQTALDRILAGVADGGEFSKKFEYNGTDFLNDPGLQFRIKKGTQALEGSATARGLFSGNDAKAINDYASESASDEYDRAYGRSFSAFTDQRDTVQNALKDLATRGQSAVDQRIAKETTAGNIINTTAKEVGDYGTDAAAKAGVFRNTGVNNAANFRMGALLPATQYRSNAAEARGAGIIGNANAWTQLVNSLSKAGEQTDWNSILKGGAKPPSTGVYAGGDYDTSD